jgi:hypothetical protein
MSDAPLVRLPYGMEGEAGECRSCHAAVVWVVRERDGRRSRAPYDLDGRHHNATCPDAGKLWSGGNVARPAGER